MNKRFFVGEAFLLRCLPLILLGVLLISAMITIFSQAGSYGITIDEPIQDQYGHAILEWYVTLGKDRSFLNFPPDTYMPEHGGIFDALVAGVQQAFPPAEHWQVRHLVTGLAGLIGVGGIALCGYELGGYWYAFLAALALWCYPRYYGAIYNNPKDVPAAAATTFMVWATLVLMRQWGQQKKTVRNSLLLGVCIGVAAAIRVNEVIWFLILGLVALGWWVWHGRSIYQKRLVRKTIIKYLIAAGIIGMTSWLTMIALWPYIFLSPVKNLLHSIKVLSRYPWGGTVLYDGAVIPATRLPPTYTLKWLVIGSPPILIVFALLGLGMVGIWRIHKNGIDPKIALILLSLAVPLGAILGLHSVLYNGLRQFLFLAPSLILLAVYGFVQILKSLATRKKQMLKLAAGGLAVLTLASYVLVVKEMRALSPFEYTYFSPVVGGLPGAVRNFESDYWRVCYAPATEWLAHNYLRYTQLSAPTVGASDGPSLIMPDLPSTFTYDATHPTFYIGNLIDPRDPKYPTYTIIHTVFVEGVPMCVVKVDPTSVRGER